MRAQGYRTATRPNPDDVVGDVVVGLVDLGGLALAAFVAWKVIKNAGAAVSSGAAPAPSTPPESSAGRTGSTISSAATGGTYDTSQPSGHGQIYV